MVRLAANISLLFREHSLMDRIGAAAQAGFRAIECLWPYEVPADRFRIEIEKRDLLLALINTPLGPANDPHFGLAACAGREAEFAVLIHETLQYASVTGAGRIHVMVGEWPETPANRAALVGNLRHAAHAAQKAGITLVIEPINARDRPNWFLKSTAQAQAIIDEVASPAVKLLFDVYHVQIIEGDLIRRLEACIDHVGHIQIAGVPERHEPDEGEVNIHAVLATLDRLGYDGFVGCEYNPRGVTRDGLGWAARYGVSAKQ